MADVLNRIRGFALEVDGRDLCFASGLGLTALGLAQFSVPVAMVVTGAVLLFIALR